MNQNVLGILTELAENTIEEDEKKQKRKRRADSDLLPKLRAPSNSVEKNITTPSDGNLHMVAASPSASSNTNTQAQLLLLMAKFEQLVGKNNIRSLHDNLQQWKVQSQLETQIKKAEKVSELYNEVIKQLEGYKETFINAWWKVADNLADRTKTTSRELSRIFVDFGLGEEFWGKIAGKKSERVKNKEELRAHFEQQFNWFNTDFNTNDISLKNLEAMKKKISDFKQGIFKYTIQLKFGPSDSGLKEWKSNGWKPPLSPDIADWFDSIDSSLVGNRKPLVGGDSVRAAQEAYKNMYWNTYELTAKLRKINSNTEIDNTLSEANSLFSSLRVDIFKFTVDMESRGLEGAAKLAYLMAKMRELLGNTMLEGMSSQREIFQEMQRVAQENAEKRAEEVDDQLRKAEEARKWAAIGGKILGWLAAVAGVVGAIFTGGASLALAAVGIALLAADEIVQATGGQSFMDKIMQPIMDQVMKLVEFVADIASKLLKELGAGEASEMIANIIAAVAVALAMIAAALVGAKLAGVAGNLMGKVIGEGVKRSINDTIKRITQKVINKSIMQALNKMFAQTTKKTTTNTLVKVGTQATELTIKAGSSTMSAALNIHASKLESDLTKRMGDLKVINQLMELIEQLVNQVMDAFISQSKMLAELVRKIGEVGQRSLTTGKTITNNIQRMA
ncbi:type III secretion system translocon subunit SctE [Proteus mirabilis]|uniref:type III secretion system translocon subunit SctE n=1 Tax=Proteus mirabilis TaxID=584 RepID=UPI0023497240|nr:type III secretion system translocon subunit SctE [Proteus mirabilis]MDC5886300.1 type III secretion system translocon subunit SctE [Proteus mirabilis]MDC5903897.1 type III secretion system translocon subunit SctE [Proteus mirabilis]MDC5907447.1 type III secretion system translocon subunit SctE [Proteus mirabilis]MDC5921554.1 type III secretion system translocon subunit SctE [Proteus mirabilis]MDC5932079.1 type III secretion system translocon subunit SctE [Proteus mirabilis]